MRSRPSMELLKVFLSICLVLQGWSFQHFEEFLILFDVLQICWKFGGLRMFSFHFAVLRQIFSSKPLLERRILFFITSTPFDQRAEMLSESFLTN